MSPPSWIHVDRAPAPRIVNCTSSRGRAASRDAVEWTSSGISLPSTLAVTSRSLSPEPSTCTRRRAACGAACQSGFPLRATSSRTLFVGHYPSRDTLHSLIAKPVYLKAAAIRSEVVRHSVASHTAGSVLTASLARDHRNCICPPSSITMGPVMS